MQNDFHQFSALPDGVKAVVGSHLSSPDLVALARTSKMTRRVLAGELRSRAATTPRSKTLARRHMGYLCMALTFVAALNAKGRRRAVEYFRSIRWKAEANAHPRYSQIFGGRVGMPLLFELMSFCPADEAAQFMYCMWWLAVQHAQPPLSRLWMNFQERGMPVVLIAMIEHVL